MVTRILDAATAEFFTETMQQFQHDIHDEWHHDDYACWTVDRPAGWEDGTGTEGQQIIETGYGRLYPNGAGGPQSGEMVIHVESPYRFRTLVGAGIETGNLLVLNGVRLFRVDVAKPGHDDTILMDVYLTELFNTPIPVVTP